MNAFKFFDFFILTHTVDFASESEVNARMDYTSKFLDMYPVTDTGFEFVVFPKNFVLNDIDIQVEQYNRVKTTLENSHHVNVHASLHFPTKNNLELYLGANDDETRERIMQLFDQCLELATRAGIRTIVVHTGGNIDAATWGTIKDDYPGKRQQLHAIAERLAEMLDACKRHGYRGKIAWENVPWPFDIPNVFSFTNIVKSDFSIVFNELQSKKIKNLSQLGICIDLCHAWIVSKLVNFYRIHEPELLPPSIFPEERADFLELDDVTSLIQAFPGKIAHVHLADSKRDLVMDDGTVMDQPTEGDELGTGEFSMSPAFQQSFKAIVSRNAPSKAKIMCTLEIKDKDFGNPEQAFRSLLYLGEKYFAS